MLTPLRGMACLSVVAIAAVFGMTGCVPASPSPSPGQTTSANPSTTPDAAASPTALATQEAGFLALPASPFADGQTICAGVSHAGPIRLAEINGAIVGDAGTVQIQIRWPPGYRAKVDPQFSEVVTDTGEVFARAGDDINSPSDVFNGHLICLDSSFGMDIWRLPASPSP